VGGRAAIERHRGDALPRTHTVSGFFALHGSDDSQPTVVMPYDARAHRRGGEWRTDKGLSASSLFTVA
jgi:hypothetical protein